ncbi:TonB family protein [Fulvivirga maritima]|uniref:TonB family protein n=1 Tax=Fulvivirga maritima TaxID=2904247 RepID=UPI001F230A0B|nr:TonB family protein [Fulvivirga maritima]UII25842.1 TonB family protein [Fulvivirga maritima]
MDKTNQAPINKATIVLLGTTTGSVSNYLGYFQLDVQPGDKLMISHPSYVLSEMAIPESDAFLILLDRKYYNLGSLSIDQFSIDPSKTKLIVDSEIKVSEDFAQYPLGWQRFYSDFGNSIVSNPQFTKLDSTFNLHVLFTVTEKGNVQKVETLNSDNDTTALSIIKTSLKKFDDWIPAKIQGISVPQYFEINISRNKEIFMIVEEPAMPIGGFQSFYDYIRSNLNYPSEAMRLGIEGKVMIQFVVDKTGDLTEIEVVKGIGVGCDEEAIRLIKNSPHWYPPYQRGTAVKQRIILPITFNPDTNSPKKRISFNDFINSRIRYPRKARQMNIESTVYVSFKIDEEADEIIDVTPLNDIDAEFMSEIKAVFKSVPSDLINEELKSSQIYILPIAFRLKEYNKNNEPITLPAGKLLCEIIVIAKDSYIPPTPTLNLNTSSQEYISVDQALFHNPNARRLSLTNKGLNNLSEKIKEFEKLVFLDLEGNNLTNLPDEIVHLDKLEELYVPNNKLNSLPNQFDLLSSLKVIGLAYNNLSQFPISLTQLSKLEALDLSGNNITYIPPEIINLKKLKILVLNRNNITELPEEIYSLKHLEKVFLADNELTQEQLDIIKGKFKKTEIIIN